MRTQRLVHDEGGASATGAMGAGGGVVLRWCQIGTLDFITTRVQPMVQSIMKVSDKNPHLTHDRTNNEQEQWSWSMLSLLGT